VLLLGASLALAPIPARALTWPDVAERVERDLQSPDAATRRSAAHEIGKLGVSRGAPLALRALGDADDEVRLAAADAAIRLRAAGATDEAASWLNAQDPRLRRKACEVARALPSPRAIGPLARSLGDPDADVRATAAEALGHQASAEAVPPLLGRLDDPSPPARVQIVAALARLGDARAVVPLVGKVQDSSPEVREAVARALGDLGDLRASPALVLALRDQNGDVRRDALAALGRLRALDAVDAIAPFAADRNPSLRIAALTALGRIASPDALRVLVQSLGTAEDAGGSLERTPVRDALVTSGVAALGPLRALLAGSPSPAVSTSAAWVLGALRATSEGPAIVAAMRRGVLPVAAALRSLAGAGTANEVPVALEFVADASPLVRDEALGAARALLDPRHPDGRAVEPLAAALRDTRPAAAQRARMATLLGRTGAARAAPLLVELTRAQDPALRLAAVDALATLGPAADPGVEDALLEALLATDAALRLQAALALARAGGARAREVLLARLDGGDEVDRAAVLTALGGIMARAPTDAAIKRLTGALDLAAGPERDSILDAIGQAPLPAAVIAITNETRSPEPTDRREAASVLSAHPDDPVVLAAIRLQLADVDADVRAQAAWTLGTLGDASDEPRLLAVVHAPDVDGATNATAALGRIASRLHSADLAMRALCPLGDEPRASVRANALAGLGLAGARCGDGGPERHALTDDPSEDVRAAAANAVSGSPGHDPGTEDARALELCARTDPSGTVAARCRAKPAPPAAQHPLLVYVVPDGAVTPRPGSSYAMLMSDGLLRGGTTDRRGAVFDPAAPEGIVTLRHPTALLR
jgi:cellulose synthase operon protein C